MMTDNWAITIFYKYLPIHMHHFLMTITVLPYVQHLRDHVIMKQFYLVLLGRRMKNTGAFDGFYLFILKAEYSSLRPVLVLLWKWKLQK